jgi:hypothetical protein
MLETINGFDLLLVLVIVALVYKVFSLNRECESYVGQIMQVSWELQHELQAHRNTFDTHHKEWDPWEPCSNCVPF